VFAFLTWGLLIGLQHALEPDHLAAVGSLASRSRSPRSLSSAGLWWGIGHAVPLLLLGGAALLAHATIPASFANLAEMAVGVMLVVLGGRVLYRLWHDRVHIHVHRHADGTIHLHAHSHKHGEEHEAHAHGSSFLVGVTHGLAGSAALVVVAAAAAPSAWSAIGFVTVFSLGAAMGMAALGAIVSVPARLGWVPERGFRVVHLAVGCATVALGLRLVGITGGAFLSR
jgi:high-affinity nickel permease